MIQKSYVYKQNSRTDLSMMEWSTSFLKMSTSVVVIRNTHPQKNMKPAEKLEMNFEISVKFYTKWNILFEDTTNISVYEFNAQ